MQALKEIGIDASARAAEARPGGTRLGRHRGLDVQRGGGPATPGLRRVSWVFDYPKNLPLERVREIGDDIDRHVHELLAQLDPQDA